ncbi:uncharacterized protein L201_005294 [Kwoniella dendrophila CBS 6074]|uniref:Uncharacterized protein n=1 Tax=Kwoniella dendrophila CBS 6074 TaxID=1295534 RepID=A0AAX4JY76_9TREE
MVTSAQPIDYTQKFSPIRDWYNEEDYITWTRSADETGECNLWNCMQTLGYGESGDLEDIEFRKGCREIYEEKVFKCLFDPKLVFPKRGEFSYGYSWPAWRKAATYAGSKEPACSMSDLLDVATNALDYHITLLRDWQTDSKLFALDLNDLLKDGKQSDSLAVSLFEGRGKQYSIKKSVAPAKKRNFNTILFDSSELPYEIACSGQEFCREWYFDHIIASLCDYIGSVEPDSHDFDHRILAYEQAIKNDPTLTVDLSRSLQQIIGELTMTQDVNKAVHDLLLGSGSGRQGCIPPAPSCVFTHWDTLKEVLEQGQKVFAEPFPDFDKIYKNGKVTEDGCSLLWEHWNSTSRRFYDRSLDELFGITDLLIPPRPTWNTRFDPYATLPESPKENESNTSACCEKEHDALDTSSSSSLIRSGHSYYRDQHAHDGHDHEKIKKRGKDNSEGCLEEETNNLVISRHKEATEVEVVPTFKVNKKQMKLVERLFSDSSDEAAQGQVSWDDIYKLMRRIGFSIDHVGGSIIRFVPPNNAGVPFNEHRPHPETSIHAIRYRAFGKRLTERYGWDKSWFERSCSAN